MTKIVTWLTSKFESTTNRLSVCPKCGARLGAATKETTTTEDRWAYRTRPCYACGRWIKSKQAPEEFTGAEKMGN